MKYIDLHVHSLFSDGTCTPEELVDKASAQGLVAFALTDHDTVGFLCISFDKAMVNVFST